MLVNLSSCYLSLSSDSRFLESCLQARPQDLAAGGGKNQEGPKTRRWGHIFKIQYWMCAATGGPNVKWGGTDFKWGAGHHWPPRWRRPWLFGIIFRCRAPQRSAWQESARYQKDLGEMCRDGDRCRAQQRSAWQEAARYQQDLGAGEGSPLPNTNATFR